MTNPFVPNERTVAYFSMEIALEDQIPTYSGGLGVLAGDTIRSAADNRVPMVAISLAHRKGYFYQRIDPNQGQIEEPVAWALEDQLIEEAARVHIDIDGRRVAVRAWRYDVAGLGGFVVPVYLLDTCLDENSDWDRSITDILYGGEKFYRLAQEAVLGIAGLRMLRALGFDRIEQWPHWFRQEKSCR